MIKGRATVGLSTVSSFPKIWFIYHFWNFDMIMLKIGITKRHKTQNDKSQLQNETKNSY